MSLPPISNPHSPVPGSIPTASGSLTPDNSLSIPATPTQPATQPAKNEVPWLDISKPKTEEGGTNRIVLQNENEELAGSGNHIKDIKEALGGRSPDDIETFNVKLDPDCHISKSKSKDGKPLRLCKKVAYEIQLKGSPQKITLHRLVFTSIKCPSDLSDVSASEKAQAEVLQLSLMFTHVVRGSLYAKDPHYKELSGRVDQLASKTLTIRAQVGNGKKDVSLLTGNIKISIGDAIESLKTLDLDFSQVLYRTAVVGSRTLVFEQVDPNAPTDDQSTLLTQVKAHGGKITDNLGTYKEVMGQEFPGDSSTEVFELARIKDTKILRTQLEKLSENKREAHLKYLLDSAEEQRSQLETQKKLFGGETPLRAKDRIREDLNNNLIKKAALSEEIAILEKQPTEKEKVLLEKKRSELEKIEEKLKELEGELKNITTFRVRITHFHSLLEDFERTSKQLTELAGIVKSKGGASSDLEKKLMHIHALGEYTPVKEVTQGMLWEDGIIGKKRYESIAQEASEFRSWLESINDQVSKKSGIDVLGEIQTKRSTEPSRVAEEAQILSTTIENEYEDIKKTFAKLVAHKNSLDKSQPNYGETVQKIEGDIKTTTERQQKQIKKFNEDLKELSDKIARLEEINQKTQRSGISLNDAEQLSFARTEKRAAEVALESLRNLSEINAIPPKPVEGDPKPPPGPESIKPVKSDAPEPPKVDLKGSAFFPEITDREIDGERVREISENVTKLFSPEQEHVVQLREQVTEAQAGLEKLRKEHKLGDVILTENAQRGTPEVTLGDLESLNYKNEGGGVVESSIIQHTLATLSLSKNNSSRVLLPIPEVLNGEKPSNGGQKIPEGTKEINFVLYEGAPRTHYTLIQLKIDKDGNFDIGYIDSKSRDKKGKEVADAHLEAISNDIKKKIIAWHLVKDEGELGTKKITIKSIENAQQVNAVDCGIHVLLNAERIMKRGAAEESANLLYNPVVEVFQKRLALTHAILSQNASSSTPGP